MLRLRLPTRFLQRLLLSGLALNLFLLPFLLRCDQRIFSHTWNKQTSQAPVQVSQKLCTSTCSSQQEIVAKKEMQIKALKQQIVNLVSKSDETSVLDEENAFKVAVVIPFVRCQVFGRLSQSLKSWEIFPPCIQNTTKFGELHLIFHYNSNLESNPDVLEELRRLWFGLSPEVRSCFQHVEFLSANLTRAEDVYPLGPCKQFYSTFDILRRSGYDHWLQFEPDVNPIQFGWGTRLLELANENRHCKTWWQLGSMAMYPNAVDMLNIRGSISLDMHMNGNSIYCLRSTDYEEFRNKVREQFPPSGCIGFPEILELGGFDHAMYRFRQLPQNRRYMNNKFSKFRVDDYIMNFGEARFEPNKLLETNPGAMLVHSKYYSVSTREREALDVKYGTERYIDDLQEAYRIELGRLPSVGEDRFFTRLLRTHSDDINMKLVWCLLHQVVTACSSEIVFSGIVPPLFDCQEVDSFAHFSSAAEAKVTGLYIYFMQAMPGPDANVIIGKINDQTMSCVDVATLLCAHPLRPRDMLLNPGPCGLEVRVQKSHLPDSCQELQYLKQGDMLRAKCRRKSGKMRNTKLTGMMSCARAIYNDDGNLRCDQWFTNRRELSWGRMFSSSFSSLFRNHRRVKTTSQIIRSQYVRGLGHTWESPFLKMLQMAFPGTKMHVNSHLTHASPRLSHEVATLQKFVRAQRDAHFLPLKLWVTDLHASPMGCSVSLFDSIGAHITAKIQHDNCIHYLDSSGQTSCANARGLQVLKNDALEGVGLDPCPKALRTKFFEHYRSDLEFREINAVLCSHPVANCELYLPFNKSIIVYATTRLEFGRQDGNIDWRLPFVSKYSEERWLEWVRNLQAIASSGDNFIAANNAYDAKYIEYFTGLKAEYIPSWCGGTAESLVLPRVYAPRRLDILLTPYRSNLEFTRKDIPVNGWPSRKNADISPPLEHPLFDDLWKVVEELQVPFTVRTQQVAFPSGFNSSEDISQFPASIFIPYQASSMTFFELYRLSIPLLVPSKKLLLSWVFDHGLLWERVYGEHTLSFPCRRIPLSSPSDIFSRDRKSAARSALSNYRHAQPE